MVDSSEINSQSTAQTASENWTSGELERRQFARVQDAVGLHVQQLADMPAAGKEAASASASGNLPQTVRKQDKYEIQGYASVKRDFPAVADYIDELEERIRELLLDADVPPDKPTHKVSLSAGGIYFSDKLLLHPGEMIGLTLTLFPGGRRIGTDARIASANEATEIARKDQPRYRAEFVRMSDADRDAVDEHVQRLLGKRSTRHE